MGRKLWYLRIIKIVWGCAARKSKMTSLFATEREHKQCRLSHSAVHKCLQNNVYISTDLSSAGAPAPSCASHVLSRTCHKDADRGSAPNTCFNKMLIKISEVDLCLHLNNNIFYTCKSLLICGNINICLKLYINDHLFWLFRCLFVINSLLKFL